MDVINSVKNFCSNIIRLPSEYPIVSICMISLIGAKYLHSVNGSYNDYKFTVSKQYITQLKSNGFVTGDISKSKLVCRPFNVKDSGGNSVTPDSNISNLALRVSKCTYFNKKNGTMLPFTQNVNTLFANQSSLQESYGDAWLRFNKEKKLLEVDVEPAIFIRNQDNDTYTKVDIRTHLFTFLWSGLWQFTSLRPKYPDDLTPYIKNSYVIISKPNGEVSQRNVIGLTPPSTWRRIINSFTD